MKYGQLYQRLTQKLNQHLRVTRPHVRNLALVTLALACSPNSHLSTLATYLPIPGQRENLIQRLRRWLANQAVTQGSHYRPLIRQLFANWSHRALGLVMDRTDLEHRWSVLMLGAAFHHRILPLAWQVLPFGVTNTQTQIDLIQQVQSVLPDANRVRTTFYGDSEFRAVGLQRYCQAQHWHWQVGLKSDLLFRSPGTPDWQALRRIPVARGQRRYLPQVRLTRFHDFGPVNLIADWTHADDTPRYVATDRPANRLTWRHGRKRFWIEPTFRDWKSYGFDLERSHLFHPERLQNLLLGMAVATLWLTHIGCWVTETGRRVRLEARHKRDYSLFRLGRDYLTRSLVRGWSLPVAFTP